MFLPAGKISWSEDGTAIYCDLKEWENKPKEPQPKAAEAPKKEEGEKEDPKKEQQPKKEEETIDNQFIPALSCIILGTILIWCSYDLPQIGLVSSPIHQHVAPDYILGSRNDIGIPNIVTSVLASYRGYDTFGETIVVFTAGIAVLVLLQNNKKFSKDTKSKIKKKVGRNA